MIKHYHWHCLIVISGEEKVCMVQRDGAISGG